MRFFFDNDTTAVDGRHMMGCEPNPRPETCVVQKRWVLLEEGWYCLMEEILGTSTRDFREKDFVGRYPKSPKHDHGLEVD